MVLRIAEIRLVLRTAETRLVLRIVAEARSVFGIAAEARSALRIAAEACSARHIVAGPRLVPRFAGIVFGEDQRPVPLVSSQTRRKARPPPADGRSNIVSVAGGISVARRGPPWPGGRC